MTMNTPDTPPRVPWRQLDEDEPTDRAEALGRDLVDRIPRSGLFVLLEIVAAELEREVVDREDAA